MKKKLLKIFKRMLITFSILLVALIIGIYAYMQQPKFGKEPSGTRLERIKKSKNYKDGQFQNISHTPSLAEGYTMGSVLWDFLFTKYPSTSPIDSIPSIKTDLKNFQPDENVLVWFGHSSYFIQLNGKTILVDPVFSGNASPVPGTTKSFAGSEIYGVDDFPEIDYLVITHDHYDHLDYETVTQFIPKVDKIVTGLGVGEHLEYWGYNSKVINEMDWYESLVLNDSIEFHSLPARHFSGRTFKRNTTLWSSFILKTPDFKIYLGGDSGYDNHFKEIGDKHGPFDLVILEDGQYDLKWKYIHMLPEEVVQAAQELKAKKLFPVHNSKFKLGNHKWNDPMSRVALEAKKHALPTISPIIGEKVNLVDSMHIYKEWWSDLK